MGGEAAASSVIRRMPSSCVASGYMLTLPRRCLGNVGWAWAADVLVLVLLPLVTLPRFGPTHASCLHW